MSAPRTPGRGPLRPFQPTAFGRFTLLSPLAAGGMGEIYLARATFQGGLDKLCVIKKVLPGLARDADFVARFVDEARTLVQLQHGSIAQVYDTGVEDGEYWIALEFVDGKDLRRLLQATRARGRKIPVELSLFVAVKVLEALAYAHRKKDDRGVELGLVHRDVSPQNVLLSYEGEVKVIDFGLARSKITQGERDSSVVMGKFYYMAPEQARNEAVDRRTDLYAVGLVLYELLAGWNPLEDAPANEVLEWAAWPRIPPLERVAAHVPAGVAAAVMRALSPRPEERFATAEEMRSRLASCLSELAPDVGPEALAGLLLEEFAEEHSRERELIASLARGEEGVLLPAPRTAADATRTSAAPAPRDHLARSTLRMGQREAAGETRSFEVPAVAVAPAGAGETRSFEAAEAPAGRAHEETRRFDRAAAGLELPWRKGDGAESPLRSAAAATQSASRPFPWYERAVSSEGRAAPPAEATPRLPLPVAPKRETTPDEPVGPVAAPVLPIASVEPAARPRVPMAPIELEARPRLPNARVDPEATPRVPIALESTDRHVAVPHRWRGRRLALVGGAASLLLAIAWVATGSGPAEPAIPEAAPQRLGPPTPPAPAPAEPMTPETVVASPPPVAPASEAVVPAVARTTRQPPPVPAAAPRQAAPPPVVQAPTPAPPRDPVARRREALVQRRRELRRTFDGLVQEHGAGKVGGIVVELERAVDSHFDRLIDAPDHYDELDDQLDGLERILEERRRAFR